MEYLKSSVTSDDLEVQNAEMFCRNTPSIEN